MLQFQERFRLWGFFSEYGSSSLKDLLRPRLDKIDFRDIREKIQRKWEQGLRIKGDDYNWKWYEKNKKRQRKKGEKYKNWKKDREIKRRKGEEKRTGSRTNNACVCALIPCKFKMFYFPVLSFIYVFVFVSV